MALKKPSKEGSLSYRGAEKGNNGKLTVEQTLLVRRSVISLYGYCKHISSGWLGNKRVVFCVTFNRVQAYNLENPVEPLVIINLEMQRQLGVISISPDRFITFGENGITLFGIERGIVTKRGTTNNVVLGLDRYGSYIYALTAVSLEIYNLELLKLGEYELGGFKHILVIRNRVVLGDDNNITVFVVSNPMTCPERLGSYEVKGIVSLNTSKMLDDPNSILIHDVNGDARVINISEEDKPQEVAFFKCSGHFADMIPIGKGLFVRVPKNSNILNIYQKVNTTILNRSQLGLKEL